MTNNFLLSVCTYFYFWILCTHQVRSCTDVDRCLQCHCTTDCSKGLCPSNGHCEKGWFGLGCQYNDLATIQGVSITAGQKRSSNFLKDETCADYVADVTVSWNREYMLTWVRLVMREIRNDLNIRILFKTKGSQVFNLCSQHRIHYVTNKILDVWCLDGVNVTEIKIDGNLAGLCSLYISGGRNFAYKQNAVLSSNYENNYGGDKAVDGNRNADFNGNSCAHSGIHENYPTLTLTLNQSVVITRVVLYNRKKHAERLLNFILQMFKKNDISWFSYQDPLKTPLSIYTILIPIKEKTEKMSIAATYIDKDYDDKPILTLCEVEAYGECPRGYWGLMCTDPCPPECRLNCHIENGQCNTICFGYSDPPLCRAECARGQWGINCTQRCSNGCYKSSCNRISGICDQGCLGYSDPPTCRSKCLRGRWGINCLQTCSQGCLNSSCNASTGLCDKGCLGYSNPPLCTLTCSSGDWGVNCSQTCSERCYNSSCNQTNGVCYQGCLGYNDPPQCNTTCFNGLWGLNCSQTCPEKCLNSSCLATSGECDQGFLGYSKEVNTTTESETTTEKGTSGKCQETTENGIIFDETSSGNEVTTQCPSGYTGYVKKKCTKQAVWEDGQFSNCTRNILDTLFSSLNGTLNQDSLLNISKTLQETFKDVGQTILSGDIKNVVNIFRDLVDKTKLFKLTVPKVVVEVLTATIDNLLAASNSSWTEISTDGNHDDTGAEMIHSLESFTQSFLQTDQHSFSDISVRKDNIVLEIKQTTSDSIRYPDPTNTEGGKLQESKNEIFFSQPAKENMKYSILEFKGMTSKFQTVKINKDFDYGDSASASKTILLNSDVISFSLEPKRQVDALKSNPLRLTFQITNHTLYRQFCVFMTKDLSWSTSGCTTKRTQANQVQCTCTHLSTFAVLMSPDVNEITTEATAKVQNCKEVIENGVIFKDTQPGKSVTAQCPEDYDGNSIKKCSIQGKWEKTNNNLCVPKVLKKVSQEAENLTYLSTPKEIENMTATVANVYKENKTIISGDIRKVVDIFAKIGAATTQYKIDVTNTTVQNITVTIDKLLSTNENDWKVVSLEDDVSAKLLLSVENITKSVLDSNTNVTEISLNKDNIAVEIKQKTVNEIIYPDPKKKQEERRNITENKIQLSQETSETFKYSIIIYKNVTEKFTIKNFIDDKVDKDQNNKQPTSKFLNSDVISFSVEPEPKSLQTNPLILTFKIRNTTGVRHVCAYLTNDSSWATDGCDTKVNKENVTCTCTHLTNFAVLMSPHAVKDTHREVLRFISAVGIVISLIGLGVTIAVYGIMWRYVKSDRSVLHVNLSVALFLGYTVFLVGIDRTHDFITCAIIAGSLHFLFLVVFFVMLAQGLLILKSVTTVSSTSILKFLFILMYGGPLLIVVLSVAITQGEGYGTKYVCWLDNSKGLIWAFAGPAFLVLVSNVVILIHVLRVMQSSRRMMDKDLKKKTMSVFRSISILTPILGITWLFGILSISIDNVLFQYLFAISNSLQGLFIFICQCVLQYQVRDGFRSMIRKYRATTSFDSSSKGASSCQDKGYSESLLQTTEPSNFFENATYDSTVVTSENQL